METPILTTVVKKTPFLGTRTLRTRFYLGGGDGFRVGRRTTGQG